MMLEPRRGVLLAFRQSNPGLDAIYLGCASKKRRGRAFGMGDAPPGHHPVDRPRTNDLTRAETIPVMNLAAIKVGDSCEADVRVRTNAAFRSGDSLQRSELVKKNE